VVEGLGTKRRRRWAPLEPALSTDERSWATPPETVARVRIGATQFATARLEAGNISPSLPTLDKVAEALGAELVVSFVELDERVGG